MDNIFPQAKEVIKDLASEDIRSDFITKTFCKCFDLFGITGFCEQNRNILLSLAKSGNNPYDIGVVSKNFKGIYPELSFSVILEKFEENDPIAVASKLIYSSLKFKNSIESNSRDKNIFGGTVNLLKVGKSWKKEVIRFYDSDFIIVIMSGNHYKLTIQVDNNDISLENIYSNLSLIVDDSKKYLADSNYGLLTACQIEQGIEVFKRLRDSGSNEIDKALFVLTLDIQSKTESLSDFGRYLHIGSYKNKDYRKSLQVLITGDGRAGLTFNLFSGIEGVAAANFAAWIRSYSKDLEIQPVFSNRVRFEKLSLSKFDEFSTGIGFSELEKSIEEKIYKKDSIYRIDSIGKDKIKKLQVSPDAFFHAALHLFYYNNRNEAPYVFNFANLESLKYPCITRYLSTTPQLIKFLKFQNKENLLLALSEHKAKIDKIKAGIYPFHYFYYYLFRPIKSLKPLIAIVLAKFFIPNFIQKYLVPNIWASNIPGLKGVECLGRFGTKLSFLKQNAIAGHYLMFDDHIKICFLANNDESGVLDRVGEELEKSLVYIYDILMD